MLDVYCILFCGVILILITILVVSNLELNEISLRVWDHVYSSRLMESFVLKVQTYHLKRLTVVIFTCSFCDM
jgi:hypothetical protein